MNNVKQVVRYICFGWDVIKCNIFVGDKYSTYLKREWNKEETDFITLWTKGKIIGSNTTTGTVSPERVPGVFSEDRDHTYPAGLYVFECVEDSEWFCYRKKVNGGSHPTITAFRLKAGETTTLPAGQRLAIFSGSVSLNGQQILSLPATINRDAECVLTATKDTYGMLFDRSK